MTTPKANVLRTVLQAIVAVCVALPFALAKVPIPAKYAGAVALVVGIATGAVVIVTALQNVIEAKAGVALFRNPTATGIEPVAGAVAAPADPLAAHDAPPRGPP
jgi:xanthosine utilization system XapX-like protein